VLVRGNSLQNWKISIQQEANLESIRMPPLFLGFPEGIHENITVLLFNNQLQLWIPQENKLTSLTNWTRICKSWITCWIIVASSNQLLEFKDLKNKLKDINDPDDAND
jgi:hypothetical protein